MKIFSESLSHAIYTHFTRIFARILARIVTRISTLIHAFTHIAHKHICPDFFSFFSEVKFWLPESPVVNDEDGKGILEVSGVCLVACQFVGVSHVHVCPLQCRMKACHIGVM